MFLAFWIRIQGVERIPPGQFTENDAFFYQWIGDEIANNGTLPNRDMHRWLPIGRDNGLLLPLYSYAIAYIHKAVAWAFPKLTRYHIQLYLPVICFILGLGVFFLFLGGRYGLVFASIVALLLATLPGSIERSAAGFGDRDAWCWMFGILAITSYLWKEQMETGPRRFSVNILSGVIVFLGGLSWETFGLFVLIILVTEIWKFCTTDTEQHLKEYLFWIFMFVPGLYLISPAYRNGYSFATHLGALMLVPPVAVFIMRGLRHLFLTYRPSLRPYARKLAWGLTLIGIITGVSYFIFRANAFESTAFILFENRVMKLIGELVDPKFGYWYSRYGTIFILGSIGWIAASLHMWKWKGVPLAFSLIIFTATTFFRDPISEWIGESSCNTLFFVALGLTGLCLAIACTRKEATQNELLFLAMFVWFLSWVALSRGGKRYDFFIGLPLAFGTAWIIWQLPKMLIQHLRKPRFLTPCITVTVLLLVLFWTPIGGHATRSVYAAAQMRKPTPGHETPLANVLEWMKTTLSHETVMAANWGYGSRMNLFGGVKTITDQDTFLPHWIHLYYRHVYCAQSTREALEYLKTHGATHLMLTKRGVTSRTDYYSFVGGDENADRRFQLTRLKFRYRYLYSSKQTPFLYIETPSDIAAPSDFLKARLKNGNTAHLPYVIYKDTKRYIHKTSGDEHLHGGVILYYDESGSLEKAYHISGIGWQSLAVRLYLLGDIPSIFEQIYPTNGDDIADFKVWKINYPLNVEIDDKYLVTEPNATAQ